MPIDRPQFNAAIERETDFMRMFTSRHQTRHPDVLWSIFEQTSSVVTRVMRQVARLGVRIESGAKLETFLDAVRTRPLVALVAHWRSARYRPTDMVDVAAVESRLQQIFPEPNNSESDRTLSRPDVLATRLNALIGGELELVTGRIDDVRHASIETNRQLMIWRRRQSLDRVLGSAVKGGPGIEFADGLALVESIAEGVPKEFAGTLDLTVCNSIVVAEKSVALSHGQILCNAFPATLDYRMLMFGDSIALMAGGNVVCRRQSIRSGQDSEAFVTVKAVLRNYVGDVHLGEVGPKPDVTSVVPGLTSISRTNELYFRVCFAALFVLFLGSSLIVLAYLDRPDTIKTIFTVTGLSQVGLVGQMIWLWKQKVTADLVISLAENLPPDQVQHIAEILIAKL